MFKGKPKACHFQFLVDRIKSKLSALSASLLSMSGILILVKTVIHSLLIHYLLVYSWLSYLLKYIERWTRNFVWSGDINSSKLVTISWKLCCKLTIEEGLDIRSLKVLNEASIGNPIAN